MTDSDDKTLAGEYVLGLLEGVAKLDAERRLASDPAFAREVEAWRVRFAAFDDAAEPQPAGDELWRKIEAGVPARHPRAKAPPSGLDAGSGTISPRFAPPRSAPRSRRSFSLWAWALRSARRRSSRRWSPCCSTAIAPAPWCMPSPTAASCWCRSPASTCRQAGRCEVWTLPSRERGPVSVGLMNQARTLQLSLKDLPPPGPDQLFEITLEPATGSPTGRPTGPVLFKGNTALAL